ncbi:MAG: serine hydrolase [Rikenellaceae bacterium]|nr:serine hydrolase [Rikenellaceae bacterium]
MKNTTIFAVLLLFSLTSCTAARMATFGSPTIHDSRIFLNVVLPATDTCIQIHRPEVCNACPAIDSLFDDHYTTGIVVARGDSIVYHRFTEECALGRPADLFSLSKSFVGALAGIALAQGFITSIEDSVAKYLPECAEILGDSARVCDLLNMRVGMFENRWLTARLYYTPNLDRTTSHAHHNLPHGDYSYANLSTQLLAEVIESATGYSLTDYFIDNYWIPTAPHSEGFWSIDSRRCANTRAFCGLSIAPEEVIKLGMIYRDGGQFRGRQIVPAEWVQHSVNPPYESADRGGATYHCQWYILEPDTEFMGQGLMGQILYINRTTDTVVARFGIRRGKTDWTAELRRIATLPDRYFR